MKRILLIAFLCSSGFVHAQVKAASVYNKVFGEFVKYYNSMNAERMLKLFKVDGDAWMIKAFKQERKEFGKIVGFKYVGPFQQEADIYGNAMIYFKVTFDKKANCTGGSDVSAFNNTNIHAAGIALNNENLISGFQLFTTSKSIDSLIAQY